MTTPPLTLARFRTTDESRVGIVRGETITELPLAWTAALAALGDAESVEVDSGRSWQLADVVLLPPVAGDAEIYCVGLNYLEHREEARELVTEVPSDPIIFVKSHRALTPPSADLCLPSSISRRFDWEVELGVVIGRSGRDITRADAFDHVAGYTIVNDITARDVQIRHAQWHLGKNVQASTPVGPWVVAHTEPPDFEISLRVNGEAKQVARTSEMIFDIPRLIETLSTVCELRVGDVIASGTPAGVGFKRNPPEFLQDGDIVEARIEGVGELVNRIVIKENAS